MKKNAWIAVIGAVLFLGGWWVKEAYFFSPATHLKRVDAKVNQILNKNKVTERFLLREKSEEKILRGGRVQTLERQYVVGGEFPLNQFPSLFTSVAQKTKLRVVKNSWTKGLTQNEFELVIGWRENPLYSVKIVQRSSIKTSAGKEVPRVDPHAPKIAFVLDDWGYNLNNLPVLNEIEIPMTLAILPHLRFSSKIPASLAGRNYEFILHMPMEAHNGKIRPEAKTLYTDMQEGEIQRTLNEALASVPQLKGISNHMGSKATEDSRLLKVVMEELQKKNLYFLDSLVTPHSVVEQVSQQVGIPFAKRDIFLDNELREEYIEAQIQKTIQQAKEYGSAIGIGHDRAVTLKVIQKMIPQMKAEGIQFVHVSQLVKDRELTASAASR
ncbi:MAG: divergent polysaccharide deacetylase family protein [Candidatus Omnitrophica bacterium]|nr:divergent polysaccharide deacetylase family protein [Candidatus Omnitrophota bacterium]